MRRFLFGVVIASVTAAMPAWAFGGDREIAKSIMTELQQHKTAGALKGFDIDLKVEDGIVYLSGEVASPSQLALVTTTAAQSVGEDNLVTDLRVKRDAAPASSRVARPVVEHPVRTVSTNSVSTKPSQQDLAVTDSVIAKLQQSKAAGMLRGFELDVSTVSGDVWLRGSVANEDQKAHVLDIARRTRGVARVVDDITVAESGAIRTASTGSVPAPIPGSNMPVAGGSGGPQPFAQSGFASSTAGGGHVMATPVAMNGAGASYGAGAPRYDQPNMPNYAWPSYAASPNYAAVTYPKQYSPSAWPYIGPFYPYPQVPLGWRKVALEWDDGLWYLDFTSK
ncbi:BON domain-containing protein [Aureliella helgolandensis]|uniref:Periplasmic protein n=1 Tax=Aureliella helgolandensis TaxID=2527968 RepID=A0A518GDJ8_9BACT|nr:BON domain-containing protein [Aureliella helgolandensis]QDV26671.1 periplasmic protein [Aureliella helgolandensis]